MKTETHIVEIENHIYTTKVDLYKETDNLVGFKVICWDRVIECHLKDGDTKIDVRRLDDDDKSQILKKGFKNVGKVWSEEEVQTLISLFDKTKGDLPTISKELERTERSVRMKLVSIDLLDED